MNHLRACWPNWKDPSQEGKWLVLRGGVRSSSHRYTLADRDLLSQSYCHSLTPQYYSLNYSAGCVTTNHCLTKLLTEFSMSLTLDVCDQDCPNTSGKT